MASVLEVEDEPEEMNYVAMDKDAFDSLHEHARLEEIARRNTLYLPHLRSVYPTELFSNDDSRSALSKDTSRSSVIGAAASKDGSRSSIATGPNVTESHLVKDGSRSNAVEGRFSRSDVIGGAPKDSSRSSIVGGYAGVVEGHFNAISRSTIVEAQAKDHQKSRLSSAASMPPESDVSRQENIKHKVSITVISIIIMQQS